MLILTRRSGEKIYIGDNKEIVITVLGWNSYGVVNLGFEADKRILITREEVYNKHYKKEGEYGNRS